MLERRVRSRKAGPAASENPSRPRDEWSRLFRQRSTEAALREIAARFPDPEGLEVVLERPGRAPRAHGLPEGRNGEGTAAPARRAARVPGQPGWVLTVGRRSGPPPAARDVEKAAVALAAWRAARDELDRSEVHQRERTREIDALQSLGRGAAEAGSWQALFAHAARVLHEAAGADAVVFAHALGGSPVARAYLARPVAEEDLATVAFRAAAAADLAPGLAPSLETERLPGFEEGPGRCRASGAEDALVATLTRRGRPLAAIAMVSPGPVEEGALRLAYGAANQVSVHLDRILTALEAEEGRFRTILDSMPQAVLLTDPDLRVVHSNRSALRLLERLHVGASGGRVVRIGSLDLEPIAAAVLAGRETGGERDAVLPGGIVLSVTVSPLAERAGTPRGLVVVLADVTEGRRVQAQLVQAEKMSTLGEMISGIAHELNNPLSSVVGYAQLIRATANEPKRSSRLEVIEREARRCQRIVQDLLCFARRYEPERKGLSLNEVAESVLSFMGYQFRVGDVRIVRDFDPDLPAIVGDAHQLQQALLNLVANAYQSVRESGRAGSVTVRTCRAGSERVSVEVADDGPGIPEAVLPRIFDPFFTTKAPGQGTGLGLPLVQSAVVAHGGALSVKSREGLGASFRIELPLSAPAAREDAAAPVCPAPAGPAGRILVVDDEESVASLICDALAEEGHRARAARNGREALRILAGEEFDLVIADLRMPEMGGAAFCEEAVLVRPDIRDGLVLTTGDSVGREAERLASERGIELLMKPFDLEDLRGMVRRRLEARRRP